MVRDLLNAPITHPLFTLILRILDLHAPRRTFIANDRATFSAMVSSVDEREWFGTKFTLIGRVVRLPDGCDKVSRAEAIQRLFDATLVTLSHHTRQCLEPLLLARLIGGVHDERLLRIQDLKRIRNTVLVRHITDIEVAVNDNLLMKLEFATHHSSCIQQQVIEEEEVVFFVSAATFFGEFSFSNEFSRRGDEFDRRCELVLKFDDDGAGLLHAYSFIDVTSQCTYHLQCLAQIRVVRVALQRVSLQLRQQQHVTRDSLNGHDEISVERKVFGSWISVALVDEVDKLLFLLYSAQKINRGIVI